jgi:hypothetical protein
MREICIKTSETGNHRRKNLSIVEMIDQDGFVARAEKKFVYHVLEQNPFGDLDQMKHWTELQAQANQKKERHVSIRKSFDDKSGTGKMLYRVIGSFYVVQNLHIFVVIFMHSIRFDMLSGSFPPGMLPSH